MKSIFSLLTTALSAALVAGSVLAAGPAPQAAKPDLAKGEAIFSQACVACHAADGNSTTPAAINSNSTNSVGLTYEYPLSKRTAMYISGGATDFSNFQPSGTDPIKPSAVALGVRHLF